MDLLSTLDVYGIRNLKAEIRKLKSLSPEESELKDDL